MLYPHFVSMLWTAAGVVALARAVRPDMDGKREKLLWALLGVLALAVAEWWRASA